MGNTPRAYRIALKGLVLLGLLASRGVGQELADWTLTPTNVAFTNVPGTRVVSALPRQILTLGRAPGLCPVPGEYRFELRFPQRIAGMGAALQLAVTNRPDKTVQSLSFRVDAVPGQEKLSYSAWITIGTNRALQTSRGSLNLQAVDQRSLAWPEDLRKIIEVQMASAPHVEQMPIRLRCTVEKGRFRGYLCGRLVCELSIPADLELAGAASLRLSGGAQLASAHVRPLPAVDARFEPLTIDGFLNARSVADRDIERGSLPAAGEPAVIDAVPFAFPAPTPAGDTHLDLGTSWMRFGALRGYFPADHGAFGGRWTAADKIDPARICLAVPAGRYKALHLIAVASGEKDKTPVMTAQFYRPNAGHPINFSASVPGFLSGPGPAGTLPVRTGDGKPAALHHVVVPLDPDAFSWFSDLPLIGLELTKQVRYYRAYPDPLEYSWHGAGLPSAVRIFAATLERVAVDVDLQPGQAGHVWTAPAAPGYTILLRNNTGGARSVRLAIGTRSRDGRDVSLQEKEVTMPAGAAGETVRVPVSLALKRYGLHELTVTCETGGEKDVYTRRLAYLHPDTRERGNWEAGRGSIFGYWAWQGGHGTPPARDELTVMSAAGAETATANYSDSPPEVKALAEKLHFISEMAFHAGAMYWTGFYYPWMKGSPEYFPDNPGESGRRLIEALKPKRREPSAINRPEYVPFFAEPQIGRVTSGIWPTHYGAGDYAFSPPEEEQFQLMLGKFLAGARAIRKEWPDTKLLVPYGDPMNAVVFLKRAPETRGLIDGVALDLPCFERLPERQMNQLSLNRLYPIMKDLKEYIKDPFLVLVEGFCISSKDIATGEEGQAEIGIRNFLTMMGYGITRFESSNSPFDCAGGWGENHYGGGWCTRLPLAMPKLGYVHYATLTRHLNRANFVKYLPTGSTSAYCAQFKHYQSGKLTHVFWTVRGKRPVTLAAPPGTALELFDPQDNGAALAETNGSVTFTIDSFPVYLEGLASDASITLGESDHSDAVPAAVRARLANLGEGRWKVVAKEDVEYARVNPVQVERFLAEMSVRPVDAPAAQGGKALAVHFGKQAVDRGLMPYYTTLEPRSPLAIEGKASHLGLWVHAASDWGRVVYVLRDAKGEKWVSVGSREEWNCDDPHCWSEFNFDGWRYLRFELPAHAPVDGFREHGTAWWGSTGGDGVADLPLKLVKVIVERRPRVIYGNELTPAKADDVLLGDLFAEYASEEDRGDEAVRQSRLRMPVPRGAPGLGNPIAEMARSGVGAPTKVIRVTDPPHQYDGTRCHVDFVPVPGATGYDVWVSPYADGRGAMQLGKAWTEPGKLIQGLRPDIAFHVFVVYTDAEGKLSKPSAPLKIVLKDRFGYK